MASKQPASALLAILFFSLAGYPQAGKRIITGTVTAFDGVTPLEGVLITVKGTNNTSGTQEDGIYYIEVNPGDSVLTFSLPEFETKEIKIANSKQVDVTLKRQIKQAAPGNEPFTTKTNAVNNQPAYWRAIFSINANTEVPVNFVIKKSEAAKEKIYFINGKEEFEGGKLEITGDSIHVNIDQFDNELVVNNGTGILKGFLRKQDRSGTPIPVTIETGKTNRFSESTIKPAADYSGAYEISIQNNTPNPEKAVALLTQEGNKLYGTLLRITGDSRFLEGIVDGNKFHLSTFIGSSPSYYRGYFIKDSIAGEIIGVKGAQKFEGKHDENAALPDPFKLTYLKEGYKTLSFSFPDINGKLISLTDEKYKNKPVIITIGGTWCPNCIDEAAFLAPWYEKNKQRGVEVISIFYERQTDAPYIKKVFGRFINQHHITYDLVLGGVADKQKVAESLPALNTFLSYPTTIFIDKKGNVAKIHTGYNGPATGKYYDEFIKEFNKETDLLIESK